MHQLRDICLHISLILRLCSVGLCVFIPNVGSQPLSCVDISMLDDLEAGGALYRDHHGLGDALQILKSNGINTVRLRLFHSPTELRDGLTHMLALAQRANDLNLKIILNLHYSDSWADPATQQKPAAWSQISESVLRDSIYTHTYAAIRALEEQGTPPIIVQTGNEITTGMLWNTGRVGGSFDVGSQWSSFSGLLKSASKAVRDASSAQIMLHIDRGGDLEGAFWFFNSLSTYGLDYDLIGLSYYPFWHGTMNRFSEVAQALENRFDKPVMLIETAYPWTLRWKDNIHNIVGLPEHVLSEYPATPEGQASFIRNLWEHVSSGICYWGPEYISAPNFGSPWENLALFNFEGEVLPAANALGLSAITQSETTKASFSSELFPNPVRISHGSVTLNLEKPLCGMIEVYNQIGHRVRIQEGFCNRNVVLSVSDFSVGVYWIRISTAQAIPLTVVP
ncbi:MAG: glycosyl hydrolase 53 family protein [Bacteroidetes bacterium]|nr:glycosyl hydrolase 53 family protein [Bacteroidota bacterium]